MQVERSFKGKGLLLVKGVGSPVDYDITVFRDRDRRWADGIVDADDDLLFDALTANGVTLRLIDGTVVEVVVTDANGKIAVNTPMPS
jgi:hypothetical protein